MFRKGGPARSDDDAVRPLSHVGRGANVRIDSLPADDILRSQCVRLGISVGADARVVERLPGGTIVLGAARQEIALGKALAEQIGVVLKSEDAK